MQLTPAQKRTLLDLARASIRAALGEIPAQPEGLDQQFVHQRAGCFVSLHEKLEHRLRGCVGRLDTEEELANVIPSTARGVLDDPRFADQKITPADFPTLLLELSVIEALQQATNPMLFDPLEDGLFLQFGDRAGCFLPQVARETGWSREKLLDRLCTEKLGMTPICWRHHDARLYTFKTLVIGPEPFIPLDPDGRFNEAPEAAAGSEPRS